MLWSGYVNIGANASLCHLRPSLERQTGTRGKFDAKGRTPATRSKRTRLSGGGTIAEQASGLNEHRSGMKRLFQLIDQQAIDVVLIEYPDRLVRFGFGYLEGAFRWKQVRLRSCRTTQGTDAQRRTGC